MVKKEIGMGEHISVGVGVSEHDDPETAAQEAVEDAIDRVGEQPTFAMVFSNSKFEPEPVAETIDSHLSCKWVGCSSDREISKHGMTDGSVVVVAWKSDYMHIGIGYADNYRDAPQQNGSAAIKEAMDGVEVDRYVDSYVQFQRTKTKDYSDIVRTPPYFVLTFMSGAKYVDGDPRPGMEGEFLEGIFEVTGPEVPLVGASASSDFDQYMQGEGDNYQFVNGEVLRDAAVCVFVVSNLYFSYGMEHAYDVTDTIGLITKLDETGHNIQTINGAEAVQEYANLLGLSKEEFLENPFPHIMQRPIGVMSDDGETYIKVALPNPDGETLYCLSKLRENIPINVLEYNEEESKSCMALCLDRATKIHGGKPIALDLVFSCSTRRKVLEDDVGEVIGQMDDYGFPFGGFYSFTEIGSKLNRQAQANNQTVTNLVIFDKLLTE